MTDPAASIAADIAASIERRLEGLRRPELIRPLKEWPRAPLPRAGRAASRATDTVSSGERSPPRAANAAAATDAAGAARAASTAKLPVLRWLPQIACDTGAWAPETVSAVCRSASALAWRQTYGESEIGREFLDNYAYTEIMGAKGPLASERVACGFLLLGPATHYPRHRHEAEELYVPLSGTASWQQGDSAWRKHAPGTPIHHASEEPHAMRTGAAPLLALYLWWNANLGENARLG
ncbi:MAG TPA: dimethylsulfonioproprionate lyase family protein [Steroidobacteraceae bacterium]|nr:dimethylsulfonioproprionate lyase family protein [Steroidobacteraceae bacterium]